jgi:hypothetical protein
MLTIMTVAGVGGIAVVLVLWYFGALSQFMNFMVIWFGLLVILPLFLFLPSVLLYLRRKGHRSG